MELKNQGYLLITSQTLRLQGKPDYVEAFERVSNLDPLAFSQISTEELLAYNQVVFHYLVMEEYAKKNNLWWHDSNFAKIAYYQLLEKRVSLVGGDSHLCHLVNSVLHTDYPEKYILSQREELAKTIKKTTDFEKPSVSNLSD